MRRAVGLTLICAVALGLRLWAVFTQVPPEERVLRGYDAYHYDMLATSLYEGRGFSWPPGGNRTYYPLPEGPTSTRTPLFPAFLATVYKVWGLHNLTAVRVVQAFLGVVLCLLLYRLGVWWGQPAVGWVAASLAAVYPPFIHFSFYGGPGRILSEGLFMLLLTAAIWSLARLAHDVHRHSVAWLSGLWLGLATLTRPVPVLFPGVLFVWALCAPRGQRRAWARAAALTTAAFFLTVLPWTVRNSMVHKRFVLLCTDSGHTFWVGNNPLARGGAVELHDLFTPEEFDPGLKMSEPDRYLKMQAEGLRFWREHPERLPKLFFRKVLMFWNVYDLRYNLWYGLLLPWALLGLIVTWRGPYPQIHRLLLGVLAYASVITMITMGSPRYRYPFEPFVVLLAAAGLVWWFRRRWLSAASAAAAVVAANVALYVHSDHVLEFLRRSFELVGMR